MGLEDFRVSLRGLSSSGDVCDWLRCYPFVLPDPGGGFISSWHYFRLKNKLHVLEIEVTDDDEPARVSVRFALCNPLSADEAFISLVGELAQAFDMDILDQESDDPHPTWFPLHEFDKFVESARKAITRRRADWVMPFGPEQFPAGMTEAGKWMVEYEPRSVVPSPTATG